MQIEIAVVGRQLYHLFELDQFLPLAAIRDQTLDRANSQPVLFAELNELRKKHGLRICTIDRKSTRLNSSHVAISYAVFCLKKKKKKQNHINYMKIKHT